MAVDMFAKIGDIKGESVDAKHKEEITILAWSWGMSNSGSAHIGGGAGSGKVNVQDLALTKFIDKSSPDLMLFCCNGTHIPKVQLTVRKAGGDNALEYVIIKLEDVLISSVSTGGSGGEDRLTENVHLNFRKVFYEYTEQNQKGGAADKPKFGWDIQMNAKA